MSVERVNNLNNKSFKNYTGPEDNQKFISKNNIIFGYNGRGKSSLAEGIKREYIKQNPSSNIEKTMRFFNRDYIKNNLLIENSIDDRIHGVVAHFGKANVNLEKHINDLQNELSGLNINSLEETCRSTGKDVKFKITSIYNLHNENTRVKNYANEADEMSDFKSCLDSFKRDINSKFMDQNSNDNSIKSIEDLQEELTNLNGLSLKKIDISPDEHFQKLEEILPFSYQEVDIPSSEIVSWLKEGLGYQKGKDRCIFCNNEINYDDVKARIDGYINSKKDLDAQELIRIKGLLNDLLTKVDFLNKANNKSVLEKSIKDLDSYFSIITNCIEFVNKLSESIDEKLKNMEQNIPCSIDEIKKNISNFVEAYNEIVSQTANCLNSLENMIKSKNDLIKHNIGLAIDSDSDLKKLLDKHQEAIENLEAAREKENELKGDIEAARNKISNTSDFAEDINDTLEHLNIDIRLQLVEKDYIIKNANENITLSISDISEGEQNLLALLYFYSELFNDKEKEDFKDDIDLVIVDDPISSLDDTNKIFILMTINNICEFCKGQVFVFTHSWNDFATLFQLNSSHLRSIEISDSTNGDDGVSNSKTTMAQIYAFWEVQKNKEGSKIVRISNEKTLVSPYQLAFEKIYEILDRAHSANDLSDDDILILPNMMRSVFENYMYMKSGIRGISISHLGRISKIFVGNKAKEKDREHIHYLINLSNAYSHEQSHNKDEIYNNAKYLMDTIRENDPIHYNCMISPLQSQKAN